jgi:hypothetical protein
VPQEGLEQLEYKVSLDHLDRQVQLDLKVRKDRKDNLVSVVLLVVQEPLDYRVTQVHAVNVFYSLMILLRATSSDEMRLPETPSAIVFFIITIYD